MAASPMVRLRGVLAVALAGLACAGCVAFGGVDRTTGAIDRSVGTARNNSILLNIVRASRHEPLYFYSISRVSGNALEDFKFSLPPVTLGPNKTAAQRQFTFGSNGMNVLDSQSSGSFDVALLESRNFYQGMLAPLDLMEADILLKQGFPRELIYRLIVQDVTIYDGKALRRFVNDPGSPTYPAFNGLFNVAITYGITTETYTLRAPRDDPPGDGGGEGGAKPQPGDRIPSARLCFDRALTDPNDQNAQKDLSAAKNECGARPLSVMQTDSQASSTLEAEYDACKDNPGVANAAASSQGAASQGHVCIKLHGQTVAIQLTTRSLFGIFQYLGQLLAEDKPVVLNGSIGSPVEPHALPNSPLLNIVKDAGRDCFAVLNDQGRYCIPGAGSDNLKTTFAIINSLQALKTAPGDLPVTTAVRIEQ